MRRLLLLVLLLLLLLTLWLLLLLVDMTTTTNTTTTTYNWRRGTYMHGRLLKLVSIVRHPTVCFYLAIVGGLCLLAKRALAMQLSLVAAIALRSLYHL